MQASPFTVAFFALLTALATGLGALPFFWIKTNDPPRIGFFNALAAGLMLGASIDLAYEGLTRHPTGTIVGALIGLAFIAGVEKVLSRYKSIGKGEALQSGFKKSMLIVLVMTAHSFAEGISVGFSFGATYAFGILIVIAIALQNIPEGLAVSASIVPRGASPLKAMGWSVFTSLPQPIMAVPAYLFVTSFSKVLPAGLGFAAGAMLWMIWSELYPEAKRKASPRVVMPTMAASVVVMLGLAILF